MYPDGKVGVDPVCVLGLNQNKGQKILLRLRTDDLLGFRKYLGYVLDVVFLVSHSYLFTLTFFISVIDFSIKKVLFHELTHNVRV